MGDRATLLFVFVCLSAVFQSGCIYKKKVYREYPVHEVRRIQVGTKRVETVERVQVGERSETKIIRTPVYGPGSGIAEDAEETIFDESTEVHTYPVYEDRTVVTETPQYVWKKHVVRVDRHWYYTIHDSWLSVPYALVAVPMLMFEIVFVLIGNTPSPR